MNLPLTIRPYTPDDWHAVCRVHDLARPLELRTNPNFPPDHPFRTLHQAAEEDGFFKSKTAVALCGDRILAFASVHQASLTFLYVHPHFHRRGIARSLMNHIVPWMGPEGYTCTGADNAPAIALYLSMGMEIACRFPGEDEGISAQCLRLAFPTSSHRLRPARPTPLALQLEAQRRGIPLNHLPREWPAQP